jgi:hypothetical protein
MAAGPPPKLCALQHGHDSPQADEVAVCDLIVPR